MANLSQIEQRWGKQNQAFVDSTLLGALPHLVFRNNIYLRAKQAEYTCNKSIWVLLSCTFFLIHVEEHNVIWCFMLPPRSSEQLTSVLNSKLGILF